MDTINTLFNDYDRFYKNGASALNSKNNETAYICFQEASKTMCKIAEMSDGKMKRERTERAKEIAAFAEELRNRREENHFDKRGSGRKDDTAKPGVSFRPIHATGVTFNDVAGLEGAKKQIKSRIINPIKYAKVYEKYHKSPSGGILFYGVPGTGKTLFAKAIAQEINACFYAVKCSDLVCELFGKTEKNIAELFDEARKYQHSIIFFDEFEALGCKIDSSSDPMKRIVPELLAQMDGINSSPNRPIIIAATNRPWDLDSAFTRPGRLDVMVPISLPDKESRMYIIKHALKGLPVSDDFNYSKAVEMTEGFNGADVNEFCEQLKVQSIEREIETCSDSEVASSDIDTVSAFVHSSVHYDDMEKIKEFEDKMKEKLF